MRESILAWKASALADGWLIAPTYANETMERAAKLMREGFTVSMITREPIAGSSITRPDYSIHAWGPDGLALKIPFPYSWILLKENLLRCGECEEIKAHVQRVGFAGRCCDGCLAAARKEYEYPGWTN